MGALVALGTIAVSEVPSADPPLATLLARLSKEERLTLLQQVNEGLTHAGLAAEQLLTPTTEPPVTVRTVEAHLLAAARYLETVAASLQAATRRTEASGPS